MEERIVAVACKMGDLTLSIAAPARHHHIIHAFASYNRKTLILPSQQGFLTNTGRYVGREEAKQIAIQAGQVTETVHDELYSEDLW